MLDNILFMALGLPSVFYLFAHSWPVHLRTMVRALVVWVVTTSPIFIAAAFRDTQDANAAGSYFGELLTFLSAREAFVYAASFLAPTFLILFDIVDRIIKEDPQIKLKSFKRRAGRMRGIFLASVVIIVLTVATYVADQVGRPSASTSYLSAFLTDKGAIIYILSILTWYCTLLWDRTDYDNFEGAQRKEQNTFTAGLAARMTGKPNG